MRSDLRLFLITGAAALTVACCSEKATLPVTAGMGADPQLPAPVKSLLPTMNIAVAQTWAPGGHPTAAPGLSVVEFAKDLDHPRWLYVLPNGDVLVAETNAPPKPKDSKGLRGKIQSLVMGAAGATVPSPNRISLLRDTNGDGVADQKFTFLSGLNSPYGMTLVGNTLYIADSDALVKTTYAPGATSAPAPVKVTDLPGGEINHHWTKNVIASPDGSKLYVTTGSNSNVGENGMEAEKERASIWEVDPATGAHRIFAFGLRNPNGMGWSSTGQLWTAVNERDEIGSDLVPDYMTHVQDGGFYGWPYSYYGQHVEERIKPQRPDLVAKAIKPDYALGPHTASLGFTFASGPGQNADGALPAAFHEGAFVGQHGSWNRKPRSGYKVIFVPFAGGKPAGPAVDVLTGFIGADDKAHGRPVGVTIDKAGGLLVADDVGNRIWRVTGAAPVQTAAR
ncbi:sorbosone dehydrogenase family protein [soil metagenome]